MKKKTIIICPYPKGKAPSQRFRFEQYLELLDVQYAQVPFWSNDQWPAIYQKAGILKKLIATVGAILKRFISLLSIHRYDIVFIHREAAPIGSPWFEWAVAKIFRKPIIFDFDDAIWLPNSSEANAKWVGRLKNHGKTARIIRWSTTVFAGNEFLANYARPFCDDVRIVPTTIDLLGLHNIGLFHESKELEAAGHRHQADELRQNISSVITDAQNSRRRSEHKYKSMKQNHSRPAARDMRPTIGWTGTHSTLKQLIPLFPLLEQVFNEHPFRFLLIADQCPAIVPEFLEFRKWNKETEMQDLLEMDIGIMPLFNTDWERGKCGFKALQYMALEIPAVVSAVGVNTEIVCHGTEGFVAEAMPLGKSNVWKESLIELLTDPELRKRMGKAGRERVMAKYSVEALKDAYLDILGS